MSDEVAVPEPTMIPVDQLHASADNPNEQSDAMFAQLVEGIRNYGFLEPLLVMPDEEAYTIVGGEHRFRAAKVLGMSEVPCHVLPLDDEDQAKSLIVRHNAVRGKINPQKFTRMFNELANRYGDAAVRRMMGLSDETEFRRLYKDVRKGLPYEARKKLDAAKGELGDVQDLARVLQRIMAESGSDLDKSFIVFSHGGREHLMVQAEERTWKNLQRIVDECREEGVDVNRRVNQLLEQYLPY